MAGNVTQLRKPGTEAKFLTLLTSYLVKRGLGAQLNIGFHETNEGQPKAQGEPYLVEHFLIGTPGNPELEPFKFGLALVDYQNGHPVYDAEEVWRFRIAQMHQLYRKMKAAYFDPKLISLEGSLDFSDDSMAVVNGKPVFFGSQRQALEDLGLGDHEYLVIHGDGPSELIDRKLD